MLVCLFSFVLLPVCLHMREQLLLSCTIPLLQLLCVICVCAHAWGQCVIGEKTGENEEKEEDEAILHKEGGDGRGTRMLADKACKPLLERCTNKQKQTTKQNKQCTRHDTTTGPIHDHNKTTQKQAWCVLACISLCEQGFWLSWFAIACLNKRQCSRPADSPLTPRSCSRQCLHVNHIETTTTTPNCSPGWDC